MPTRRSFLQWSVGTALFYGLGDLGFADEAPAADAYAQAVDHMRRTGSLGVAIAIPTDPTARAALGTLLDRLVTQPATVTRELTDVQRLFLSAVFVCAPPDRIPRKEGETIVFLDQTGARHDGAVVDLTQGATLVAGLETLLHAEGRLEALAAAVAAGPLGSMLEDIERIKDPTDADRVYREPEVLPDEVRDILLRAWPHPALYFERALRAATAARRALDLFVGQMPLHDPADLARLDLPPAADAFERALARMKETGAHGVALVMGDAFPAKFIPSVGRLLEAESSQAALAARRVVFFRVRGTPADMARLGDAPSATFHLLAPDGTHLSASEVDPWEGSFEEDLCNLVHGLPEPDVCEDDRRAQAAIEAGEQPERFTHNWPAAAAIVQALRAACPKDYRHAEAFRVALRAHRRFRPSPTPLPFGVRWGYDPVDPYESSPCPGCGLASAPLETRRFLDFYVR